MAEDNNSNARKRQSAMENNGKRQKINKSSSSTNETPNGEKSTSQVNQNQPDQLVNFSKYVLLPSELRHHALTYAQPETLKNYAGVSSLCNEEVRKFNVISPQALKYIKTENKVEIELVFKNSNLRVNFGTENDVGKAKIVEWINHMYKYVRDGGSKKVSINSKDWPDYIMNMRYFNQVNHLTVVYRRRLTGTIMEYIEKWPLTKLELLGTGEDNNTTNHEVVPRRFFTATNLKKITEGLNIQPSCDIDKKQFMALESNHLIIQPLIVTGQMIEAKIATINLGTCKCEKLSIKVSDCSLFRSRDYHFYNDRPPTDPGFRALWLNGKKGTLSWMS